jgi:hypothetical protein
MFLKSMVAVMAASMRAPRLFERSIARRSAAASASEGGPYASGVGRQPDWIIPAVSAWAKSDFFVHPDELDQVFDAEVGEHLDAIFSEDGRRCGRGYP